MTLAYRDGYTTPVWRLRYRIGGERGRDGKEGVTGTPRVMVLGKYTDLSLADARRDAKQYRARVTQGADVATENRERKRAAVAKVEEEKQGAHTVSKLADKFFEHAVLGKWKHPDIVRSRIENHIRPIIGELPVKDVKPLHIQDMLQTVLKRGFPTIANDVLRWTRRMFNHAVKLGLIEYNPTSAFDLSDAGGKEEARTRALSRDELVCERGLKTA